MKALVCSSLRWAFPARIALELVKLGTLVEALCPPEHPLALVNAVRRRYPHQVRNPLRSLREAMLASQPDLVVPCDDLVAQHLHELHAWCCRHERGLQPLRRLIERSLGNPGAVAMASDRARFARHAEALGLRIPPTQRVDSVATPTLARRARRSRCAQARRELGRTRRCLPPQQGARSAGVRASFAACDEGRVLAGVSVRAVQTQHATGPATVIDAIEHPEMSRAATAFARELRLSGLWGFDFILDEQNVVWLLEINPRATPVCHLPLGAGRDLMTSLARLGGGEAPIARPAIQQPRIALFPGEQRRDADSPHLAEAYHDVPWEEPGLVADGVAPPWSERGWIAQSVAALRKRRRVRRVPFPTPPNAARTNA